jgi:P-type E1-E2 ATPase
MEQLGRTDTVAFDKTGTLTEGTPRVAAVHPIGAMTEDELLALAAAAERPSEHPLATAIVAAAHHRGLILSAATGFDSAPGRGVSARVDGYAVRVGSPAMLADLSPARALVASVEAAGRTAVLVLRDAEPVGVLALADQVRPDAVRTVAELATLTGRTPILLTGDNAGAAGHLAAEVGITEVHAGLLPVGKVAQVHRLQRDERRVLFVGDGVNDAPALAAADLGLAMGRHGSDLALETADAVIVRDELAALAKVIDLSRRARRLVSANLIIAATVITGLVVWDLAGHLPLPLGVAGHESSTVIVGLNGLRLLRNSAWRRAGSTHSGA